MEVTEDDEPVIIPDDPPSPTLPEKRPHKVARVQESQDEPLLGDTVGGPATSSSTTPAEAEEMTRAPGTPVGDLLQRVPRAEAISSTATNPRTPVEDWPAGQPGFVPHHIQEIEDRSRSRSPADSLFSFNNCDSVDFEESGWSGAFFNYQRGDEALFLNKDLSWSYAAKRGDEISLKDLNAQEKKLFDDSDKLEWQAILQTKAVHVIVGEEAARVRKKYPDRIVSSRMVRRKKPLPELHAWKAKSRWCVHGHRDPDTGSLVTYAPTPQAEGIAMFNQVGLNLGMKFAFTDAKNAFCQSRPLHRPKGPLFAEPCEGFHLPPGALIVIDVPVYGLDDAPAAWRATVSSFLTEDLEFERNLVEPCWCSKFDKKTGECLAQILVEVDDFIVASKPSYYETLKVLLNKRFHFGKWDEDEAEYAGRHIKVLKDKILID